MALYQVRSISPEGAKKFIHVSSLADVSVTIAEAKANQHTDICAINLVSGAQVSDAMLSEKGGQTTD
ncbi:MAG: hypothetical protein ABL932_19870 [Terricaulis sp.]